MICATSLEQLPGFGINRISVTCGVFDGLHRGHQQIVDTTRTNARKTDSEAVVLTFLPHPRKILRPESAPLSLYSRQHQIQLLSTYDVGVTVVLPFNQGLASLTPDEFIKRIAGIRDLDVCSFCTGKQWRFGKGASGDINTLRELGRRHGFEVVIVPEIILEGQPISSTRLRKTITDGDLNLAREMLGRNFSILGTIEFGKGIATSDLNYPTANLDARNEVFPPYGVYAALVKLVENRKVSETHAGVLYLGGSPTYLDTPPEKPFVEIHIFDFHRDIYGQSIEVEFIEFIREDRKFASTDELRHQISRDIEIAKSIQDCS